jgi:hypothetical protein
MDLWLEQRGALVARVQAITDAITTRFVWKATPGSPFAAELANTESGPDGPWGPRPVEWARDMAMHWLTLAGHHCVGLGALYRASAVHGSAWVLARAAVEHCAGVAWLLDPTATIRQRCGRAQLQTLDDVRYLRNVAIEKAGPQVGSGYRPIERDMETVRLEIKRLFDPVSVGGSRDWSIEGERLSSWTQRIAGFVGASWPYNVLSARSHPTTTAFVNSMRAIPEHPLGMTTFEMQQGDIDDLTVVVLRSHVGALTLMIDYHGWDAATELASWRDEVNCILPATL